MAGKAHLRTILFNAVLTVILIGVLGFNYQQEKALQEDMANTQGRPPGIGSVAPEFYVRGESGQKIKFQDQHEQDTLLVLWDINCLPSVQFLGALHDMDLDGRKLQVMPVSIADSINEVKEFYKKQGWDFPVFVDADKSTKWAFKASITPAVYLIDKEGQIIYRQLSSARHAARHALDYVVNWIRE